MQFITKWDDDLVLQACFSSFSYLFISFWLHVSTALPVSWLHISSWFWNWRAPWKNRISSTSMKLRKSLIKPVTRQNISSCSVLSPEIVMHDAFNVILWTSADIRVIIFDGRHFENSFIAISQPEIIWFQQNLVCRCWLCFQGRLLNKIPKFCKSKWRTAAILKIVFWLYLNEWLSD